MTPTYFPSVHPSVRSSVKSQAEEEQLALGKREECGRKGDAEDLFGRICTFFFVSLRAL